MKKLLFILFLFIAGIVFSQTNPSPEKNDVPELSITENETVAFSDGEDETDEITKTNEEPEESLENISSDDTTPSLGIEKRPPFWTTDEDKTVTYEFPQWAKDLRRGEIITFGAFPIMVFFSKMFLTRLSSVSLTDNEVKRMFGIAALSSVAVAVVDHFIIKHKRKKSATIKATTHTTPPKKSEIPENMEDLDNTDDIDDIDHAIDDEE